MVKNGFGFVLSSVGSRHPWLLLYRHRQGLNLTDSLPKRLRQCCEELGAHFCKTGAVVEHPG